MDPASAARHSGTTEDRRCQDTESGLNADEAARSSRLYNGMALCGAWKFQTGIPGRAGGDSDDVHERASRILFPAGQGDSAKLAPYFIAVANIQLNDMSLIRAGNERVLAARLADAKFFFDEDRKIPLEERVKKLGGVTFHQKLGTMAQKLERVRKLAGFIAQQLDQSEERRSRIRPGCELCKADLLTGIVGEFPELQGLMGGEYARHDGESDAVAQAIREQYLPKALEGELPHRSRTGAVAGGPA